MLRFGAFELDPIGRVVRREGIAVEVQDKALELLLELGRQPGEIVPSEALRCALWPGVEASEPSLRQVIHRLRAALGDADARLVQTVRGRGLRLAAEPVSAQPPGPAEPAPAAAPRARARGAAAGALPVWPTRFVGRA